MFDIPEKGIHVTFDWNYLNEEIEISKFINLDLYKNITIIFLIVISIPQFTVYHKYLDPLIIILAFTLDVSIAKNHTLMLFQIESVNTKGSRSVSANL